MYGLFELQVAKLPGPAVRLSHTAKQPRLELLEVTRIKEQGTGIKAQA
jgi:hypothetical protein